jgi:hypothetical protein
MNQWYLIQFKPNSHRVAERNLHRQGFQTFLPMQKITRRKASRFVSDLKPLFPGYMFVSVDSDLVVRFRHLAPIFACPRPNVEISRTTSNDKFLVAFLNLTFVRRDCGIGDTNVKFTPLVP